jgi:hypothetical protein
MTDAKIAFKGIIISVQPRIRLMRSFDERSHNYLGYALFIRDLIYDPAELDHQKVDGVPARILSRHR